MKLPKLAALLAATLAGSPLLAAAAHGASLAEYQQRALQNRPLVQRYQTDLEIGETDRELARAGYLPSVDVGYTVNALKEDTAFENNRNSVAYGAVTWNLFRGFRDTRAVDRAGYLRDADAHRLRGVRQDIALEVALRYLDIYSRQAQLEVARDSSATLEKLHIDAANRYRVGLIKKNDLLKFKVDLDNALIATRRAEAEVSKALRLLERAVGDAVAAGDLSFAEFAALPVLDGSAAHQEYAARMLAERSEILALRELEEASRAQVEVERAGNYPSLDLTASYRNYDDDFFNDGIDPNHDEVRGQLALSFNLFDGHRTRRQIGRAELTARTVHWDRLELENELKATLANLFFDYDVNFDNAGVALASIEQAAENLRITRVSYKEGLSTESDLLDANTNLTRARENHVAAQSEAFANYFKITRAVDGFEVATAP